MARSNGGTQNGNARPEASLRTHSSSSRDLIMRMTGIHFQDNKTYLL